MISAISKVTGLLYNDITINVDATGSISEAINSLPPMITAKATIKLAGDKTNTIKYSLPENLVIDKIIGSSGELIIEAADDAMIHACTAKGGGADFVTVLKSDFPLWNAGDWAEAELVVVSDDLAAGDIREVVSSGISESDEDGNTGSTHWKLQVTGNFTGLADLNTKFVVNSVIIKDANINVAKTASGHVHFKNISLNAGLSVGDMTSSNKAQVKASSTTFTGGISVWGGFFTTDPDYPIYVCGYSGVGITLLGNGVVIIKGKATENGKSYITKNASGIDISWFYPGGSFLAEQTVFDKNDWASTIYTGQAAIKDCDFYGTGNQIKVNVQNASSLLSRDNNGASIATSNGGVVYS